MSTVHWRDIVHGRPVVATAFVREAGDGWLDVSATVAIGAPARRRSGKPEVVTITCHVDTTSDAVGSLHEWRRGTPRPALVSQVVYLEEAARGIGREWRPGRYAQADGCGR